MYLGAYHFFGTSQASVLYTLYSTLHRVPSPLGPSYARSIQIIDVSRCLPLFWDLPSVLFPPRALSPPSSCPGGVTAFGPAKRAQPPVNFSGYVYQSRGMTRRRDSHNGTSSQSLSSSSAGSNSKSNMLAKSSQLWVSSRTGSRVRPG